uniref:UDP-N-acetylglucosamine transporter ROCK1 isoform X2 n=1 Tax=Elaeis guineensis var. tenera TaxID=51953 RepID=A0A6I9S4A7_ELAGV|nr:UDP-N-acetylglucosamine transporter ROCK1 isoform X2 [Elaeis guineensis]
MASATPAAQRKKAPSRTDAPGARVWLYLALLTLQYGAQPLLSKRFVGQDVIVTTSVLSCEVAKVICALILLAKEGSLKSLYNQWTLVGSLTASGLPAAIYALQNSLLQISYRQKQSVKQVGALAMLIIAAILLSVGESSGRGSSGTGADQVLFYGIIPVMVASVLSGLASSLCQWASQVKKHTSYLMTIEMSVVGSLCLLLSTYKSPDGEAIRKYGFFHGWTAWTLLPTISNAVGGILVGLVTAHAGGVRKGFVIVSALLVTATLQFIFDGKPPSFYCLAALPLVISSIFIYQKYPYRKKED